jgi:methylmalonyl-CoA/ethylmalonyl-CoA epimerase
VKIERVSHIGIAVKHWEEQVAFYRDVLGLELEKIEEIADQRVRVALFRVGEITIELLDPLTADSPVAKFLDKRGEGIHHIAYAVDGLDRALAEVSAKGIALLDPKPRCGADGQRIAFLHPRSTHGVLTELCE